MFNILHIINNDSKFVPFIELTFDLPEINNYYIKDSEFEQYTNFKKYHCIIIHFLSYKVSEILNSRKDQL